MLNFRKLKQDFSSSILKEGRALHEQKKVVAAKVLRLDNETIRLGAKIVGNFENTYESEIEIDRFESQTIHSNCDCPYRYDCQHLAALMFFLEEKIDSLIVTYSRETDISEDTSFDKKEKKELLETIEEAKTKEVVKKDKELQKQILQEYKSASQILSYSPFFLSVGENQLSKAELLMVFNPKSIYSKKGVEFQLALRLPFRSKPLQIAHMLQFIEALRYEEAIFVGGKRYFFSLKSFGKIDSDILTMIMNHAKFQDGAERAQRSSFLSHEDFGMLLAHTYQTLLQTASRGFTSLTEELPVMPCLFVGSFETPLRYSPAFASLRFVLEYIEPPSAKLLLKPTLIADKQVINLEEATLFECAKPGVLHEDTFFRFPEHIKRMHLKALDKIRKMTIPEPLFGTFVENSLPQVRKFAEIANTEVVESFTTIPYASELQGRCSLSYLDGELEATLYFTYDGEEIPASDPKLSIQELLSFISDNGILARNLVEERKIFEELFQDFIYNPASGTYIAKTEKKIVEFMTGVVPKNQHRIHFECPQNLLDQFIYDNTSFSMDLDYEDKVGHYSIKLKVDGPLKGVKLELLWDCIAAKRSFIELSSIKQKSGSLFSRILVLDLKRISKIVQLFDELGIVRLDTYKEDRPLWNLVTIDQKLFENLPVTFKITDRLQELRKQMLGETAIKTSVIPKEIKAELRPYQKEGVQWLEKLRLMFLSGILADDMGLGKTVQAICAITQLHKKKKEATSLIVCPTSLLYNWKEEIHRFNPNLTAVVVDGVPTHRRKMIDSLSDYDVLITSYTLLQKDIEYYQKTTFDYSILDEAQHIKNRGTRNAKSVKMIQTIHRLILTGTPIENSLEDLWSLFDYLMPNLLSTFDRFVEKYIRVSREEQTDNIQYLKRKLSPFILRRMKTDVLKELPAVSELNYHCQLSEVQLDLYKSYAASARDELTKLVERDGFDKVQIHVLATLTRLKQICCHPAIFAKEKPELGDSSKYEMLLELLQTLVEGGHKTVIFSQYTRMLQIMREDFKQRGIRFSYLDGSTKNRLEIVKEFNENEKIPVFLVSLKAGGTGLNLVGADTVIHYDMWWNPAVENQATDRVHRLGQKNSVSAYKLITLGTIEEKIIEMQKRKKGLVKKVVSCDDEAIAKLTWEDVLELLQT